jgi:hypothetical protein
MRFVGETWHPLLGAPSVMEEGAGVGLLVRALRLAAGPGCWPLVERVFRDMCGPRSGAAAARLFRILLQGLALGARRPLRLGFVGAPELSHDERSVMQMIAAAQSGDVHLLNATAAWLARPAAAGSVARAAAGLAELLAAQGALLCVPLPEDQLVQRPHSARIASVES